MRLVLNADPHLLLVPVSRQHYDRKVTCEKVLQTPATFGIRLLSTETFPHEKILSSVPVVDCRLSLRAR